MPVITQRRWLPLHWIHAAVLGALSVGAASADNGVSTTLAAQSTQQSPRETLLQTVRAATERFKDVSVAEAEGYHLLFGCVTGPDSGAMGLHYVNMQLVQSGTVDATRSQMAQPAAPVYDHGLPLEAMMPAIKSKSGWRSLWHRGGPMEYGMPIPADASW